MIGKLNTENGLWAHFEGEFKAYLTCTSVFPEKQVLAYIYTVNRQSVEPSILPS